MNLTEDALTNILQQLFIEVLLNGNNVRHKEKRILIYNLMKPDFNLLSSIDLFLFTKGGSLSGAGTEKRGRWKT